MTAKLTANEFITKSKKIHNNLYDYSKVVYVDRNTPVIIIDPVYGEFTQLPSYHLKGRGNSKRGGSMPLTNEMFITKAREVHGDLYDYSKVNYINSKTKICIIDPEYGEFIQEPSSHLNGRGHPSRGRKKRDESVSMTTAEFIEKAKKVHGDLYDYSKVKYVNTKTKVIIIDPDFGEFEQNPLSHLKGVGSRKRSDKEWSIKSTLNTHDFIIKAREVHGDLYDYSKVNYINSKTKICIIDPEYGEFDQTPASHLSGRGNAYRSGCGEITTELFIKRASKIHNNLYDYSKTVYVDSKTPVIIIDPIYGEFEQNPNNHLQGKGNLQRAAISRGNQLRMDIDIFIAKAREVHGDLYDYSKVEYVNCDTNIIIIDPDYGEFEQTPYNHLNSNGSPYRICNEALCISRDLDPLLRNFTKEKKFNDCKLNGLLRFDRFVYEKNILMEYDGQQHFDLTKIWHKSINDFNNSKKRDKIKTEYAINNGYNFIRIAYYEDHVAVLKSFLKLIEDNPGKQIVQIYGEVQII